MRVWTTCHRRSACRLTEGISTSRRRWQSVPSSCRLLLKSEASSYRWPDRQRDQDASWKLDHLFPCVDTSSLLQLLRNEISRNGRSAPRFVDDCAPEMKTVSFPLRDARLYRLYDRLCVLWLPTLTFDVGTCANVGSTNSSMSCCSFWNRQNVCRNFLSCHCPRHVKIHDGMLLTPSFWLRVAHVSKWLLIFLDFLQTGFPLSRSHLSSFRSIWCASWLD